jgi:calcium/calmodulin-dependent protein kinase I
MEIPRACRFYNEDEDSCEAHYKLGRTLGQGAFATVKLATELTTQKTWAVKVIKRSALSQSDSEALKSELEIVQTLHHPNVVSVHEIYNGKVNCFIIMECCSGGEMYDRIISKEHYSEAEAVHAAVQMLLAINYCHEQGVVHRDLKPENLLYSSPAEDADLKLADFGLARAIKPSELLHNQCGTPGYVAPEVLLSTSDHGYDSECDLWSIGVIIFILLCGYPPFYDDDNDVL